MRTGGDHGRPPAVPTVWGYSTRVVQCPPICLQPESQRRSVVDCRVARVLLCEPRGGHAPVCAQLPCPVQCAHRRVGVASKRRGTSYSLASAHHDDARQWGIGGRADARGVGGVVVPAARHQRTVHCTLRPRQRAHGLDLDSCAVVCRESWTRKEGVCARVSCRRALPRLPPFCAPPPPRCARTPAHAILHRALPALLLLLLHRPACATPCLVVRLWCRQLPSNVQQRRGSAPRPHLLDTPRAPTAAARLPACAHPRVPLRTLYRSCCMCVWCVLVLCAETRSDCCCNCRRGSVDPTGAPRNRADINLARSDKKWSVRQPCDGTAHPPRLPSPLHNPTRCRVLS